MNVAYERRKAVALAWKKEKSLVSRGMGTRDWSKKEQKEILSKGKATGYQGHHMKSVDGHNSRAGDINNIQFLNRKEHLAAHKGDFHNNTNGYYDPTSGTMNSFGRSKPSIEPKRLSDPLSKRQVDKLTNNRAGFFKSAAVAGYMKTSLNAHDAGYKTVNGYAMGKGGAAAARIAGAATHTPSDVSSGYADSIKEMSHAYDDMYAAKHPEAVIDFTPSPVSKEQIDRNTLVLEGNPYASGGMDASRELARSMPSRDVKKSSSGASESKALSMQRSGKRGSAGSAEIKSKTLAKQRAEKPGGSGSSEIKSKALSRQRSSGVPSGAPASKNKKKHGL